MSREPNEHLKKHSAFDKPHKNYASEQHNWYDIIALLERKAVRIFY